MILLDRSRSGDERLVSWSRFGGFPHVIEIAFDAARSRNVCAVMSAP